MRRRPFFLALALTGLAVAGIIGFGWVWFGSTEAGVTRTACWHIRPGMDRAGVEAVLGGPPGVYSAESDSKERAGLKILRMRNGVGDEDVCFWYGDEGVASVVFGPDDRVVRRHWSSRVESFVDRLVNRVTK
jgi:hypothetical protein